MASDELTPAGAATPQSPQVQALHAQLAALQHAHQALQNRFDLQAQEAERWVYQRTNELAEQAEQHRKAEKLQRVLYQISERATAGLTFYEFLKSVHRLLGDLMYARNFFVALYNEQNNTLDFPYFEDAVDGTDMQDKSLPFNRDGPTAFVLKTGKPQLIDAARFAELQKNGELQQGFGNVNFSTWLGVPMQLHGKWAGVLVMQSYEAGVVYTQADVEVLTFVANHFSSAIERYQAIDALKASENRYRSVIENVGVGVAVVQDERMVFVNPHMVRMTGHAHEHLMKTLWTAHIHTDDMAGAIADYQQRMRAESSSAQSGFRIVTAAGDVRSLEVNAVPIDWNQRPAMLMLMVDATERHLAAQAQKIALEKQIELSDIKSRFVSMTSHEFRTPLATIHGSVELLLHYDERMPPEKKRAMLERINDAVDRMLEMLDNVLLIGRTDALPMQFKPRPLPIKKFCATLLDELRSAKASKYEALRWRLDMPADDAVFMLDEALIRNIAGNLLSNAVKYTPAGGTVEFVVQEQGDRLTFKVVDHGIGIPEQDMSKLFESFHRASNVGSIAGTGLGLKIVKDAVLCHGGTIDVQSTVGHGSTFTVVLPSVRDNAG